MYEAYWNLSRRPFEDGIASDFYFGAGTHQAALMKLRYMVEQKKGIGLIVGEHGLGKTFLTHVLERDLSAEGCGPFVRLVIPQLTPSGTLAYMAMQLGADLSDDAPDQKILCALEEQLDQYRKSHRHPVLVVDDAHLLEVAHLNLLRLLLNLREQDRADFSMILCGRTEVLARLRRIAALDQRVIIRTTLQPLLREEIAGYVRHRLTVAGELAAVPFSAQAMAAIWELSQGIPRRINQVCDLAMLVGFVDELQCLGPVEIEAAAEELAAVTL